MSDSEPASSKDITELSLKDWIDRLISDPQQADRCDRWNDFSDWQWVELLSHQPQLAGHYTGNILNGFDWTMLLIAQPQLAFSCEWHTLSSFNWQTLLSFHPQFAEKCHCWEQFSADELHFLITKHPQLAIYRDSVPLPKTGTI